METGRATDAPFVVALGDSFIALERQSDIVRRMADAFDETRAAAVIALERIRREDAASYGIVLPRDGGFGSLIELADLVEKPRPADAPSTLAIAARYVLSPRIFAASGMRWTSTSAPDIQAGAVAAADDRCRACLRRQRG